MPSQIYFAMTVAGDDVFSESSHLVSDYEVLSLEISETENDFATATLEIKNPGGGLLNGPQWAWISSDEGDSGILPLFFGRVIGIPENLQNEIVSVTYVARPSDFVAQRAALADSLKVFPYWDPVLIPLEKRSDPDQVLAARPEFWHVDRVTHNLTTTNYISGEDGTVEIDTSDIIEGSMRLNYSQVPGRVVKGTIEIYWEQEVVGDIDLTQTLYDANAAAGGGNYSIDSYTGDGLAADWPESGDRIGSGWEVLTSSVTNGVGSWYPSGVDAQTVYMDYATTLSIPLWRFQADFSVTYAARRSYSEILEFTVEADIQPILADPGEDSEILLHFASSEVSEPIDEADTANPDGVVPIGDRNTARSYLKTTRGKKSLEYALAVSRAVLLRRARAVDIEVDVPWEAGLLFSCRRNANITDSRLPGGSAAGKIIGYKLIMNGDLGVAYAKVKIGCSIGEGNTVSTVAGSPTYCEAAYCGNDYQFYSGSTIMPIAGEITYNDFSDQPIQDDGIDFANLLPSDIVQSCTMVYGKTDQITAIQAFEYGDLEGALDGLNQIYTEFILDLVPLQASGPFETPYTVTTSGLMVPNTINLSA